MTLQGRLTDARIQHIETLRGPEKDAAMLQLAEDAARKLGAPIEDWNAVECVVVLGESRTLVVQRRVVLEASTRKGESQ